MTKTDIRRANRKARCQKRAQFHKSNRETKRLREKILRSIADNAVVFGAVDMFLRRNDLVTLIYANDKANIQLIRKNDNAESFRVMGFSDAVGYDHDDSDEDDEGEDDNEMSLFDRVCEFTRRFCNGEI